MADNNMKVKESKSAGNVINNTVVAAKKGIEAMVATITASNKRNDIKIKK